MTSLPLTYSLVNSSNSKPFAQQQKREVLNARIAETASVTVQALNERNISRSIDAINFILVDLEMPTDYRAFVDAVSGTAHTKLKDSFDEWFEASDLEIGKRARPDRRDEISNASLKKWTQRARKKFLDWQKSIGYTFIQVQPGGQNDEGVNQNSRYKVPLLKIAVEVLNEAKESAEWRRRPDLALREAAKFVLVNLPDAPPRMERFRRPKRDTQATMNRNAKTIDTLFKKNLNLIAQSNSFDAQAIVEAAKAHYQEILGNAQKALAEILQKTLSPVDIDVSPPPLSISEQPYIDVDTIEPEEHSGGGIEEDFIPANESRQMIDAFESVGADYFQVTCLNEAGEKTDYQSHVLPNDLRGMCDTLLPACEESKTNVILRPVVQGSKLIQLDDLDLAKIERVSGDAFLVIETSKGNFQAWLAIKGDCDAESIRQLKQGVGTDKNASGATRIAGSRNFKAKHAPNYPYIRLRKVAPARTVTIEELQAKSLLQAQKPNTPRRYAPSIPSAMPMVYPSYRRCLIDAPEAKNHEGKDRSHADFMYCLIAYDRGFDVENIAKRLMLESEKADREGWNYALHTAKRAVAIAEQKRGQSQRVH